MKIGVDLDDVVVEWVPRFLEFYNSRTNSNLKFEEWKNYFFEEIIGISRDEARVLIDEFVNSDFHEGVGLIEGVKKGIEKLSEQNEVIIITSRPLRYKNKTEEFLDKHNLKLLVFYSRDSNDVYIDKGEFCQRLGVELIIEDSKEYSLSCADRGIRVFLFDKPWNQGDHFPIDITRVYSWKDILGKLENAKLF